jgi:hypothetical protein
MPFADYDIFLGQPVVSDREPRESDGDVEDVVTQDRQDRQQNPATTTSASPPSLSGPLESGCPRLNRRTLCSGGYFFRMSRE